MQSMWHVMAVGSHGGRFSFSPHTLVFFICGSACGDTFKGRRKGLMRTVEGFHTMAHYYSRER